MPHRFVKMHGLGNDFMIVEWPLDRPPPTAAQVKQWADRRLGVGFDSLLMLSGKGSDEIASYRVFNADGGEVEQCGNGVRCLAAYIACGRPTELSLASSGGIVDAAVLGGGLVKVSLGEPDFRACALPFVGANDAPLKTLALPSGDVTFGIVSMGNPHAVISVDSVEQAPVGILGAELAEHADFPRGVNVGFVERESTSRIKLRVYERGVGETRACGTGAAAAMAHGRQFGDLAETVDVSLPGGVLSVSWQGQGSPLWQSGQTTKVFEGLIEL